MSRFPYFNKAKLLNCKGKGAVIIFNFLAFSLTMASHPLDIGNLLRSKGFETHPSPKVSPKTTQTASTEPNSSTQADEPTQVRIRKELWDQLNQESRRMFTSRIWRGVDFNPMLSELEDLSKLSEKWLKWAVPTYVNGLKSGPIKAWFEGQREARDFHYVLVGEHLQHLKRVRKKKEDPNQSTPSEHHSTELEVETTPEEKPTANTPETAEQASRLESNLHQLDDHIAWFQKYVTKTQD
jgi:hypothetical protein